MIKFKIMKECLAAGAVGKNVLLFSFTQLLVEMTQAVCEEFVDE